MRYSIVFPTAVAISAVAAGTTSTAKSLTSTKPLLTDSSAAPVSISPSSGGAQGSGVGIFSSNQHISSVCMPSDAKGDAPDLSFPCNAAALLFRQCVEGKVATTANNSSHKDDLVAPGSHLSRSDEPVLNGEQRLCACESQFFDQLNGCAACDAAHGGTDAMAFMRGKGIASMSSSYCAVSATPTAGLLDVFMDWFEGPSEPAFVKHSVKAAQTSKYSDPLGSSTAVSLYFTPMVTGSQVLQVPTITNSAGKTTMVTSKGQIIATAKAAKAKKGSTTSSTSTGKSGKKTSTSKGEGAAPMKTEAAAVAGVLGLAAVVAML